MAELREKPNLRAVDDRELVCEHCGGRFHYDDERHCWKCDSLTCPQCFNSLEGELCPECAGNHMPSRIEPMLAKIGSLPQRQGEWGFEFKWDGIRALSYWDGEKLRIESRNLIDITFRYPELDDLGKQLGRNAIVDGEIIAVDKDGRPSFSLLQQRMHVSRARAKGTPSKVRISYYIFDVLYRDGRDLMGLDYSSRREVLEGMKIEHPNCFVPPSYPGEGKLMLETAKKHKLEGVVCKKLDSVYVPGRRSSDWRKVKIVNSREFIIGGFRYEKNARDRVGSLQLGAYDEDMKLRFVGSVGTGFAGRDHEILLETLRPVVTGENAFDDGFNEGGVQFVTPRYVVEVEYRRWPAGGSVQQASYKGLRPDKSPGEITLEEK